MALGQPEAFWEKKTQVLPWAWAGEHPTTLVWWVWLEEKAGRLLAWSWSADVLGTQAVCGTHRSTPYSAYDPETYSGHWKQPTVRTSRRGQAMAIAYFHPQVSGERAVRGRVSGPEWTSTSLQAFSPTCFRSCALRN